jgi:hypothetical protein
MKRRPSAQLGLEFPETGRSWPAPERFRHNSDGHQVGDQVVRDLAGSAQPLIMAGYASLDRLLALIDELRRGQWVDLPGARARVPWAWSPRGGPTWASPLRIGALEQEIRDYWLSQRQPGSTSYDCTTIR